MESWEGIYEKSTPVHIGDRSVQLEEKGKENPILYGISLPPVVWSAK
jgi:hypothetical protein